MGKRSKLYKAQLEKFDKAAQYQLAEAVKALKEMPQPKFDQTVELSFKLGVDPKQTDQTVRGALPLPKGTGKQVKVCVIADDDARRKEAADAGADFVGYEDIIGKIKEGWVDFDVLIANALCNVSGPSSRSSARSERTDAESEDRNGDRQSRSRSRGGESRPCRVQSR